MAKRKRKKKTVEQMKKKMERLKIDEVKTISNLMLTNFKPKVEETIKQKVERRGRKHKNKMEETND